MLLVDGSGRQQTFEVADFHVGAFQDHVLTVVWAVRPGATEGPYIAVLNRTTGQPFFRFQSWGLFIGPMRMFVTVGLALLVSLPLAFASGGLGLALPFIAGIVLRQSAKRNIGLFRQQISAPPVPWDTAAGARAGVSQVG